jgi:SpoVK/Ycf46/Vps4 family AAA+-type ATPase
LPLQSSFSSERVFILAASNLPWDLDVALLRRLEKRIYIPLPAKAARKSMIQMYLSQQHCQIDSSFDFDNTASETEGFSGADIKLVSAGENSPINIFIFLYVCNDFTCC